MFVGQYGVSFAAHRVDHAIPLWVLFLAVQFLDSFVVVVAAPDDGPKVRARSALAAHGGHFINYYPAGIAKTSYPNSGAVTFPI